MDMSTKIWNIKDSNRSNIQRLLNEDVALHTTDDNAETNTFSIEYDGMEAGQVICAQNKDMTDSMEILFIEINPTYKAFTRDLIRQTIHALWDAYPNHHKILVSPEPESRGFWAKMGANRLNDSFMMILRGH